jgi:hypothetical protein
MLGNDSQVTDNPITNASVKRNRIVYAGTHTGHSVLFGGNILNGVGENNIILGTGLATDQGFGFVVKNNSTKLTGNIVKARVPLILKGAKYTYSKNNTYLATGATSSRAVEILDDTDTSEYNTFTNDIIDGSGGLYAVFYQQNSEGYNWFRNCDFIAGSTSMFYDGAANRATIALMQANLWSTSLIPNGVGCISEDPQFVNAAAGDFNTVNMDLSLAGGEYIGAFAPTDASIIPSNFKKGVGIIVNGMPIDGTFNPARGWIYR